MAKIEPGRAGVPFRGTHAVIATIFLIAAIGVVLGSVAAYIWLRTGAK